MPSKIIGKCQILIKALITKKSSLAYLNMLNYLSKINADEKKKIVYLPTEMGCLKLTYYDNDMGALRKKFFFLHGVLRKKVCRRKKPPRLLPLWDGNAWEDI